MSRYRPTIVLNCEVTKTKVSSLYYNDCLYFINFVYCPPTQERRTVFAFPGIFIYENVFAVVTFTTRLNIFRGSKVYYYVYLEY